jgi:hypothetical protein
MNARTMAARLMRVIPLSVFLWAGLSGAGAAQGLPQDRLSPSTRAAIERIIDSARVAGLPTAPLVDKVAEGTLKAATDERILGAVRTLARELGIARDALGPSVDVMVLGAAASAVHAGVPATDLRRMARASGAAEPTALASALVTLVDLVAKQVPVAPATRSIEDLLNRRATDKQFAALRADVGQDILAGRSPEQSLIVRATAQLRSLDPASLDVMPRRPPNAQ